MGACGRSGVPRRAALCGKANLEADVAAWPRGAPPKGKEKETLAWRCGTLVPKRGGGHQAREKLRLGAFLLVLNVKTTKMCSFAGTGCQLT